jgi:hypothetical protein
VIRFSAALVTIAIGVLLGGVATSKLLLVYIAIVVSAVALIALAVGVVLKRAELFGEGQALPPAAAGASAGLSADVGANLDRDSHDRIGQNGLMPAPPSPLPGTAALPDPGQPPSTQPLSSRRQYARYAYGRDGADAAERPANPVPSREPAPSWEPAPSRDREPWRAADRDRPAPSWHPAPGFTPAAGSPADTGRGGRHAAPADTGHGAAAASTGTGRGTPAPSSPSTSNVPDAPSWFDRLDRLAAAHVSPVPDSTAVPDSSPADSAPDVEEDWPTRYSWLDDEDSDTPTDMAESTGEPAAQATDEAGSPDTGSPDTGSPDTGSPNTVSWDLGSWDPGSWGTVSRDEDEDASADRGEPDATETAALSLSQATERTQTRPAADPAPAGTGDDTGADTGTGTAKGTDSAEVTGADPGGGSKSGSLKLVTVVPGVKRYHDGNCILIRFMQADDVEQLTIPAAKETGCTPCAACQPED